MTALFFNFHNLVGIQVISKDKQAKTFFREEYEPYLVDSLSPSLFCINLPFQKDRFLKIPENFTKHTHKLLARWGYRINIKEKSIDIDAIGNNTSISLIHHMLLHPSLRYLAALQGVLMLHAGAIVLDEQSWLFTGYGGAGKTTTVSLLLQKLGRGKVLHADDYLFISPGVRTFSYLTRAHLYLNLISWLPELKTYLSPKEKQRLWFFGQARKWSGERLKWPLRMAFNRMWQGYEHAPEATPAGIIWLERSHQNTSSISPFNPTQQDIEKLAEMNFYEARHFLELVRKANAVPDFEKWLDEWKVREMALLKRSLEETPSYILEISHNTQDLSFLSDLEEMIVKRK